MTQSPPAQGADVIARAVAALAPAALPLLVRGDVPGSRPPRRPRRVGVPRHGQARRQPGPALQAPTGRPAPAGRASGRRGPQPGTPASHPIRPQGGLRRVPAAGLTGRRASRLPARARRNNPPAGRTTESLLSVLVVSAQPTSEDKTMRHPKIIIAGIALTPLTP